MSRAGNTDEGGGGDDLFGDEFVEFESVSTTGSWMVTYADMMTIILTFMILLLSISTIAQTKFDLMVEAMTGRKVGNLHDVKTKVDKFVKEEAIGGQVRTDIDEDGLKIQFSNALLFPSGSAKLSERGAELLDPITDHLTSDLQPEYGVTIEGYTDDVPIDNGKFDSNWELSTQRSIHVMRRLAESGFDRRRMSVQGFADTRSATDVDLHDESVVEQLPEERLSEVRAANRRVVLRINRLDREVVEDLLADDSGKNGARQGGRPRPPGGDATGGAPRRGDVSPNRGEEKSPDAGRSEESGGLGSEGSSLFQ